MNNLQEQDEPFDFSKYASKSVQNDIPQENNPVEETTNQSSEQNEKPFDFKKFSPKEPPTKLEEFQRHVTRGGARALETVAGFPKDLVNFVKFISEKLPEGPSFLKREPSFVGKAGKALLEKLPSSQELKEVSSYLTSGFTDPQGALEELGDDVISLATSLAIPAKNPLGFTNLLKSVGIAGATKGTGEVAKHLGAGPTTQSAVELGTLFLTGLLGKKTADKFVSDQYKQAQSKIPQGTMLPTQRLTQSLNTLEKDLSRGIPTNTKNEVQKAVGDLKAKASGGAMEADELIESYHNINERLTSKKLLDELKTSEKKLLKHRYDKFKDEVNVEINDYGKNNPEFIKQWRQANQAFATIEKSKKVSNYIESITGSLPKYLSSSIAVELFTGHPNVAGATVLGAGAVKAGELLYRIVKSPKLREHYLNVIKEAGKENLPAVIKNLEALDKESKDLDKS